MNTTSGRTLSTRSGHVLCSRRCSAASDHAALGAEHRAEAQRGCCSRCRRRWPRPGRAACAAAGAPPWPGRRPPSRPRTSSLGAPTAPISRGRSCLPANPPPGATAPSVVASRAIDGERAEGGGPRHGPTDRAGRRLADGPFEQEEAQGGHDEGRGELDEEEGRTAQPDPGLVEVEEDRPVPEVEPVADESEPPQGANRRARLTRRSSGWTTAAMTAVSARAHRASPPQNRKDESSEVSAQVAARNTSELAAPNSMPVRRPGDRVWSVTEHPGGERCAHGDGGDPRLGALVQAGVGGDPGRMEHDGQPHGGSCHDHGGAEDDLGPVPSPQQRVDDQRPHHVELLLDRKAPGVQERRLGGELVSVDVTDEDVVPVGDVEERGQPVAADAVEGGRRRHELGICGDGQQHRDQGGEEAPGPACPEPTEARCPPDPRHSVSSRVVMR